ncbi:nucleoside diphosphatase gda1 [Hyaloraphidium curvatum]|nr:nucleoside diphosphatase gda1 [Hyaloraphidium curvatum]
MPADPRGGNPFLRPPAHAPHHAGYDKMKRGRGRRWFWMLLLAAAAAWWYYGGSGKGKRRGGGGAEMVAPEGWKWIGSTGKPFLPITTSSCTPPSDRPPVQYALMIDAGSTGSRIHVYRFRFCGSTVPKLDDELFVQTKPGLSSFADDPEGAAKSLDLLMKAAEETVPEKWRCKTPVAVKATAGLRLLGKEKSEKILKEVKKRVAKGGWKMEGVEVMDGKDEGVFAWITVNFLLGRLGLRPPRSGGTVAIMDLGGASTQVVFEPRTPTSHPAHRAVVAFDGREHILYQHSYLGYGLMQARKRITAPAKELARGRAAAEQDAGTEEDPHPCLPHPSRGSTFETCSAHALKMGLFNQSSPCPEPPCGFDGVHMPPLDGEFGGEIVAFSYFYDRFSELDLPDRLSLDEIRRWAEQVCLHDDGPLPAGKSAALAKKIKEAARENPHFCLDMTYIASLLQGYGLGGAREVKVAKKVEGVETGWCLGASIELVDKLFTGKSGHRWLDEACER